MSTLMLRLASLACLLLVAVGPAAAQPQFTDENFEQLVFQHDQNAAGARKRLHSLLSLQVGRIDQACKLTQEQKNLWR